MVWPATKADPEETETKRRTSKLPVKTINSLYFVHQFPVGSMLRPSPWCSSPLLLKSLSFTLSKQLHTVKNRGMRLEWRKSQLVQAGSSSKALFSPLQVPYSQGKVSTLSLQSTAACGVFDCLHDWLRILWHCKENSTSSSTKMFPLVLPWQDKCIHCSWGPKWVTGKHKNIKFKLHML